MPQITLVQGGEVLDYSVDTSTGTDPLAVYTGWAAELGVSPTGSDVDMSWDDTGYVCTLGAPWWTGATNVAVVSSEGALWLYKTAPANTSQAWSAPTAYGGQRFWGIVSRPLLFLGYAPSVSTDTAASFDGRIRTAGAETILYQQVSGWNAESAWVRAAVRVRPGRVTLHARAAGIQYLLGRLRLIELLHPATSVSTQQSITLADLAPGQSAIVEISQQATVGAEVRVATAPAMGAPAVTVRNGHAVWVARQGPVAAPAGLLAARAQARVAVAAPLGPAAAVLLPRANVRVAAAAPMSPGAVVAAMPAAVRAALPSAIGRPAALLRARSAVVVVGRSAIAQPAGLLNLPSAVRIAAASPLGASAAVLIQPRATLAAVAPTRPARLLADPLPLRLGTELPGYRTEAPLPWVYGTVTLRPLPLDAGGLEWLLADHPVVSVAAVRAGGTLVSGWERLHRADDTGQAVAVLRLTRAVEGDLAVTLTGRPHAQTGRPLAHPADIAADLCERCGISGADWSGLRDAAPGLAVGGVLDAAVPLREALAGLVAAAGCQWSARPLRAWVPDAGAVVGILGPVDIDDASADTDASTLATRLTLTWGHDWATGRPAGAVTVAAPEQAAQIGDLARTVAAPWLRTARDAEALARALLATAARPAWSISLRLGPGPDWRLGDRVDVQHPWVPAGPAEISQIASAEAGRDLTLTRPAGPAPRIALVRHSAAVDGTSAAPSVVYRDGTAVFTITDPAGAPLQGAAATLDEAQTAYTDRQGRVTFRGVGRGAHSLLIVAEGYAPMAMEVTL